MIACKTSGCGCSSGQDRLDCEEAPDGTLMDLNGEIHRVLRTTRNLLRRPCLPMGHKFPLTVDAT